MLDSCVSDNLHEGPSQLLDLVSWHWDSVHVITSVVVVGRDVEVDVTSLQSDLVQTVDTSC